MPFSRIERRREACDKRAARYENCRSMNLTISTLACPDWSLTQVIEACVSAGIGGIDFPGVGGGIDITPLPEFTPGLGQKLSQINGHHLKIPRFNNSVKMNSPNPPRLQGSPHEG